MAQRVIFTPEAEAHLLSLFRYIAHEASATIAERFTTAIVDHCASLDHFPKRGTPRDDLRPGLRTLAFRRSVTIAYCIRDEDVAILGVFYRGQDFEGMLRYES